MLWSRPDGAEVPPNLPKRIEGTDTLLIEVGSKGKYAIVLGLYDDAKEPLRYQRVPLDSRFADSPEMLDLMVAFQGQLEQLGFEGLGIRPKIHPRAKIARRRDRASSSAPPSAANAIRPRTTSGANHGTPTRPKRWSKRRRRGSTIRNA